MPNLLSILSNSAGSLSAHQGAIAVASNNLQNVNTPGYARQQADLTASTSVEMTPNGDFGTGVSLLTVTQTRDKFIEGQMPSALSDQAQSSAEADTLEAVTALDPDSPNGLTASLGNFYASMRQLAQNPADQGLRQAVVDSGRSLSLAFNQSSQALETARSGVDAQLGSVVDQANTASSAIATLNRKIRIAASSGSPPNDLLDQRQNYMDQLATLTGATPVPDDKGSVSMVLPGGVSLVSGDNSSTLSLVPDPTNAGHPALKIAGPGGVPAAVPPNTIAGTAGGLLNARDGALGDARKKLDQTAYDFATSFNTVHAAGVGLDGSTGNNFFTQPTAVDGAASSLSIDPTVRANPSKVAAASDPTTLPGDGRTLLTLIGNENQPLSNGLSIGDSVGRVMSDYGASAARARATQEQDQASLDHLTTLRDSASGVSIDEELVNLTKSQRAYEAASKVITTSDAMLETLMSLRP